jgi:hypothetical protein
VGQSPIIRLTRTWDDSTVVCQNPFKIPDQVMFAPDERTVGWEWPTFERIRLKFDDVEVITRRENVRPSNWENSLGVLLRGLPLHLIDLADAGIAHRCDIALWRDGYEILCSIQ